jgi:hypothetical protein
MKPVVVYLWLTGGLVDFKIFVLLFDGLCDGLCDGGTVMNVSFENNV